jgi:hypothetical protein
MMRLIRCTSHTLMTIMEVWQTERFSGKFSVDGNTLIGTWELLGNDENWAHWMDIRLTKVE